MLDAKKTLKELRAYRKRVMERGYAQKSQAKMREHGFILEGIDHCIKIVESNIGES